MKYSSRFLRLLTVLAFGILAFAFASERASAYEWGSGGGAGNPCEGDCSATNTLGWYDCTSETGSVSVCPRWILVPKSYYNSIRTDSSRIKGSYTYNGTSGLPICENDGDNDYIIVAGNQFVDGRLKIQNIISNIPQPKKSRRIYFGIADASGNVTNYYDRYYTYRYGFTQRGGQQETGSSTSQSGLFFNGIVNGATGKTYKQILDEVIAKSGISEDNLAVACASMIIEAKDTFEGEAIVNSATTTGWQKEDKTVTSYIDCDPVEGCMANFQHNLRRTAGTKDLTYSIERTSNYSSVEGGVVVSNQTATFSGNNVALTVRNPESSTVKLYPGQVVCEKLTFKPTESSNNTTLTACASALGDAQPPDPPDPTDPEDPWDDTNGDDGSSAFIKMEVRNESVSRYSTYRKLVYAKPNDTVKYRASYNPILQYTYNLKPQQMRINSGAIYPSNSINTTSTLGQLFNTNRSSNGINQDWNNAFKVFGSISTLTNDYAYVNGDVTKQVEEMDGYKVQPSDVGEELTETAKINYSDSVKTTPSQVSFTSNIANGNNTNLGNVITTERSSSAVARVPYNFNLDVCIKNGQSGSCVEGDTYLGVQSAGQKTTVYYEVDVEKKINSETTSGSEGEAYATRVPMSITKIIIYKGTANDGGVVSGEPCGQYGLSNDGINCWYSDEVKREGADALNNNGSLDGYQQNLSTRLELPDEAAGTSYCMAAAVYPASSADVNATNYGLNSTGWKDKEGNHMWRISKSVCFTIGKRPTFQVWGGSFYGGSNIVTASTAKNYLTDQSKLTNGVLVFSSWVEQTVVANGRVTELASGAATGTWSDASEHNLVGGGSYENPSSDFCKYRVPLSIANYADSAGFCHGSGNHVTGEAGIAHTRVSAKDFLTGEELENVKNEDISINVPVVINKNETYIQYTLANVYINSDIVYGAEQYEELSEIPKAVIAANNIIISCDVNRVDAILVAKNKVTSCDDYTGKDGMANQPERARQLTINGLVSTGELELGRTYGMSNGIASRIPAEIVNYDVSVLLWINGRNTTDDYDKVYQAYLNELAPRY